MRTKNIEINTGWLYYTPSFRSKPDCSMYFGDSKSGIPLFFNFETNYFELNINPHGDKKGIPIVNLDLDAIYTTLSFDVITNGKSKRYAIHALSESDKVFFRLFDQLHGKGIATNTIKPNDNALRIGLRDGMILEFATTNYDENGNIIPLAGIDIRIQEFNSEGKPDSSENLLRTLPIVAEKFVFIERKEHLFHEIDELYFIGECLVVETKGKVFKSVFQTVPIIFDTAVRLTEVRTKTIKI